MFAGTGSGVLSVRGGASGRQLDQGVLHGGQAGDEWQVSPSQGDEWTCLHCGHPAISLWSVPF